MERPHLGRWMVAVAVIAAAAAAIGIPARATTGARVTGDEPQYLLTATSLGEDGDLDISDELEARRYVPYHEVTVNTQTIPFADGSQVSPHDPLLPALLAAPMRLGGWVAAKAALAAIAAALAAATCWLAVRRFGVSCPVAALVVGGAAASMPLAAYGSQVYPELPAALVVIGTYAAITAARPNPWTVAAAVAGLLALPWLSVKYVPHAAVLGLGLLWTLRQEVRRLLPVLAVVAMGAVAYLVAHHELYGGWTAYASGDHFAESGEFTVVGRNVDVAGRARRLSGLLVDRSFGIAVWSPLWLFAPAAAGALAHRRPPGTVLLLAAVTAGWLNATFVALTMHGWWMPGRQLVVVLPLVVVAIAWLVQQLPVLRLPVAITAAAGVASWVWLTVDALADRLTYVVTFMTSTAPTFRLLRVITPDGMRAATGDDLLLAAWTLLLAGLAVAGWWAVTPARQTPLWRKTGGNRAPATTEADLARSPGGTGG